MSARNPWLQLWPVWVVPAILVIVNIVWLGGMRGAVLGRGSILARQVQEAEDQVARLESQEKSLGEAKVAIDVLRGQLATLRDGQLGSMGKRLVPFLVDVVQRGSDAGLASERIGYQAKRDEESGLVYFTASYEVEGTYEQIRKYISLLEASPQFVVIEKLELRGLEDASALAVKVRLGVGTYFYDLDRELMEKLGVGEVSSGG
jgi:Tfp pilus assembly protein PilO